MTPWDQKILCWTLVPMRTHTQLSMEVSFHSCMICFSIPPNYKQTICQNSGCSPQYLEHIALLTHFMLSLDAKHVNRYSSPYNRPWRPRGVQVQLYPFFNLGTRWGWVVNAMPWLLYALGKRPDTHCTGSRAGPMASLNRCKKSHPYWDSIPRPSRHSKLLYPTALYQVMQHMLLT